MVVQSENGEKKWGVSDLPYKLQTSCVFLSKKIQGDASRSDEEEYSRILSL